MSKFNDHLILDAMEQDQELKSLKRGLKAMTLINSRGSLAIAELSRALELPRTTAERVLKTLLAEGFVSRDPDSKRFFLTERVCALSGGYTEESWIAHVARPILFKMTHEIGWPLCIATSVGEYMQLQFTTDPITSLNIYRRRIGNKISMARSSSGIVHLAFLEEEQQRIMLRLLYNSEDIKVMHNVSSNQVDYAVRCASENGYSFGLDLGRERSLSVPILHDKRIKAALVFVFIPYGLSHDAVVLKFLPILRGIAHEIQQRAFGFNTLSN